MSKLLKPRLDERSATRRELLKTLSAASFTGLLTAGGAQGGPPDAKESNATASAGAHLTKTVRAALREWEVPGAAIAAVANGRILLAEGFGFRNINTREPVTPETIFGVGSVTKSFTATALAMLVDEHKLEWDKPVKDYLPQFQTSDPYVTSVLSLRDIACHRTGIEMANYLQWRPTERAGNARHPTRTDIVRAFKYLRFSESFRSKYSYKNNTWVVAGAVIEAVSGRTWDQFIHERIFAPLGMQMSSTSVNENDGRPNVAAAHVLTDGRLKGIPLVNADVPGPMGSINSSALDMTRYLQFHLGDGTHGGRPLLTPVAIAELHQPQMVVPAAGPFTTLSSYALGWWVQDYRGHKLVHHAGVIVGGCANVAYVPEKHLGVVVLVNANASGLARALTLLALDAYLGADAYDWNRKELESAKAQHARDEAVRAARQASRVPNTKPSLPLAAYAGRYHNDAFGDLEIAESGGTLTARLWTFTGQMTHWHYDTFSFEWDKRHYYLHVSPEPSNFVRFDINEAGVTGQVSFMSMGLFRRVKPLIGGS